MNINSEEAIFFACEANIGPQPVLIVLLCCVYY